jgi:hypothetical protein
VGTRARAQKEAVSSLERVAAATNKMASYGAMRLNQLKKHKTQIHPKDWIKKWKIVKGDTVSSPQMLNLNEQSTC